MHDGSTQQAQACIPLQDNTLVLFTNDNGSPTAGYGVPLLRGAKQDLTEGGIRAGLLAYGPSVGACKAGTCAGDTRTATTMQREVTAIGSMVDLFPTIADAAGYDDLFLDEAAIPPQPLVAPKVTVCSFGGAESTVSIPCTASTDCYLETDPNSAGWEAAGTCDDVRGLDGVSLLQVLGEDPGTSGAPVPPSPAVASPERDQVFAAYPASGAAGMTVITRQGRYADECDADEDGTVTVGERTACGDLPTHVCAYERAALIPDRSAPQPADSTSGRTIMGASCTPCLQETAAGDCDGAICEILGGVCFDNGEKGLADTCVAGTNKDSECGIEARARCQNQNDCLQNQICRHGVRIPCKSNYPGAGPVTCVEAGWKAKGGQTAPSTGNPGLAHAKITDIYDLPTNPEESDGEDLNCEINADYTTYFNAATVDLDRQLGCWRQCLDQGTTGDADGRRCDKLYAADGACE